MSMDLFAQIYVVLVHLAALVGTASVVVHLRVRWRASVMGKHLLTYMAAVAVVLDLSVIRMDLGGDTWWFQLVRLVAFAGVTFAMSQRLYLQVQAQRRPADIPRKG